MFRRSLKTKRAAGFALARVWSVDFSGVKRNRRNSLPRKNEPVGTRFSAEFRAEIESLFQNTAESTALANEVFSLIARWTELTTQTRAEILKLVGVVRS
jgi:hypothetical protein